MSPDNETEESETAQSEDFEMELSDESLEAVAGGRSKSEDPNRDANEQPTE